MVGASTAKALSEAGVEGVCVLCGGASGMPSSSNDMTRIAGTTGACDVAAAAASVRAFRLLEERSGVAFWHNVGLLEVLPSRGESQGVSGVHRLLSRGLQYLSFQEFFGRRGFDTHLSEQDHGWMDPRGFVSACRALAEREGATWMHGNAHRMENADRPGGGYSICTREGQQVYAKIVVLALGAFAPLSPGLFDHCGAVPLETTMWGKCVYHARISAGSARNLAALPALWVWPADGVPAPAVSYSGSKAGTYFYLFPPVLYPDGHHYIKIGHSPFDPIISTLGRAAESVETADTWLPPKAEQVHSWFSGAKADTSTAIGRDVVQCVQRSEEFFVNVLGRLFTADVEGGHIATCVTAKSRTGDPLLAEIAPGLFHQTGCNGSGATAALKWGEDAARLVRQAL